MAQDTVVVPEGHKVVVIHPYKIRTLEILQSGITIADFGKSDAVSGFIADIKEKYKLMGEMSLVVIIQNLMNRDENTRIEINKAMAELLEMKIENNKRFNFIIVLPDNSMNDLEFIKANKQKGVSIFRSADDGACFLEVHKPDGKITIGFPGNQL